VPTWLNYCCFGLVGIFLGIFFQQYFFTKPWIHPEVYRTFHLQIKEGANVFREFIPTLLNLDNFEMGHYRPRILSFLIDYININSLPILNKLFPEWGLRLISNPLLVLALVYVIYRFFLYLFPKSSKGFLLLLSVSPIFFIHLQSSMGRFYRASRFLQAPLCLALCLYFLSNHMRFLSFRSSKVEDGCSWREAIIHIALLFLATLYVEEIVLVCLFFAVGSGIVSLMRKQLSITLITFSVALVLYVLWYLWLGKIVFGAYTPHELKTHPHGYWKSFSFFTSSRIMLVINMYFYEILNKNFVLMWAWLVAFGGALYGLILQKEYKTITCILALMGLSLLSVFADMAGHSAIFSMYELRFSEYLLFPVCLFYVALIWALLKARIKYLLGSAVLCLCVYHVVHMDEYYTLHYGNIGHLHSMVGTKERAHAPLKKIARKFGINADFIGTNWGKKR